MGSDMIAIMSTLLMQQLAELPSRRRTLGEGQYLFRRDDPVNALYVVRTGELRLVRQQPDGAVLNVQRAHAGRLFAEASVFASHYHCDAVATKDSAVDVIAIDDVRRSLEANTTIAMAWARYLSREVQAARFRAELLSLKTVAGRLDAWLAWHDAPLPAKGEWHLLARELGVRPEPLYREIARRRAPKPS